MTGGFGPKLIAEDMLALLQQPDEEDDSFIAQLQVGTETAAAAKLSNRREITPIHPAR